MLLFVQVRSGQSVISEVVARQRLTDCAAPYVFRASVCSAYVSGSFCPMIPPIVASDCEAFLGSRYHGVAARSVLDGITVARRLFNFHASSDRPWLLVLLDVVVGDCQGVCQSTTVGFS